MSPKLAGRVISTVMKLFGLTWRFRVEDRCGFLTKDFPAGPIIYLCWHNRIFVAPVSHWRLFRHRKAAVLTSASKDGDVLASVCKDFGYEAARGSSSRRQLAALRDSLKLLKQGLDLCITPDGPRGPRYELQPGIVVISQKSGRPVLPLQIIPRSYWQLKTWDGFIIPKPFSKIDVIFDHLVPAPSDGAEEIETHRQKLEALLVADPQSARTP